MILVTGATGLVGVQLLADLLLKEVKIRALYRTEAKIASSQKIIQQKLGKQAETLLTKIEWVKADITRIPELTDAFEGIDHVYHCAGLISYDPKDYKALRKINIEGTANVVNISLSKNIKKFCRVSSIAALGSELNNQKVTENSPRNNELEYDNYSICKYGAEMEVWRASQEGLNVVIVNPGVIIGSGNWNTGSGQIFSRIDKGLSYYLPLVTGFVAVEDVSSAMIKLMEAEIKNERFIVVGENLSFKEVQGKIAEALNKPQPTKALQPWMVFLGWIFQSIGSFLFNTNKEITRKSIKAAFNKTYYDHTKIKTALPTFEFTSIDKAVKTTAAFYVEDQQ